MPISNLTNQYWDIASIPQENQPIIKGHFDALKNSLMNVFRTPYMDRGGCFRPDWGVFLNRWLHEPLDEHTAIAIKMTMYNDIERNHPFVQMDMGNSYVNPMMSPNPGYHVHIVISSARYLEATASFDFNIFKE